MSKLEQDISDGKIVRATVK